MTTARFAGMVLVPSGTPIGPRSTSGHGLTIGWDVNEGEAVVSRFMGRFMGIDIGSIRTSFAWAAFDGPDYSDRAFGLDPESAVADLAGALDQGHPVAVGVEMPLAVPIPVASADGWGDLGQHRAHEGTRAWSASTGPTLLATGLEQIGWIASRLAGRRPATTVTTRPDRWLDGRAELLVAEAFVSGVGKPPPGDVGQHVADASAAADALAVRLTGPDGHASDVECAPQRPMNLAALAVVWAGLAMEPDEIRGDVLVVRTGLPRKGAL